MPALEPTTLVAVGAAALAAVARIAAGRAPAAHLARASEWALLAAAALAMASVALPQAWTASVLGAPPLADPRIAGGIAVAAAALPALAALSPELVAAG